MMEFSSLYSSSDNLFKFLTVSGVLMIILSLVYPLQKQQAIDIELNSHNKQVELINEEISLLKQEIDYFTNIKSKEIISIIDSLKANLDNEKQKEYSLLIEEERDVFNSERDQFKKRKKELDIKLVILDYNEKKTIILNSHLKQYNSYSWWFKWIGIIASIIGLILWSISTRKTEKLKSKEL